MKIRITHPYLEFPVNTCKTMKKLLFSAGDKLVFDLDIRYDPLAPDYTAYVDLRRFMGQTLTLSIEPDIPLFFREANEPDYEGAGREPFRPHYHFTVKNGWINDPNGLVRDAEGTYHLFFQYNPAEPAWGNMHWGHAVSTDLIRWDEQPIALFPDESGTVFSGSGLLDAEGRAGFGKNALLFYYTAAGGTSRLSEGMPFTQCLACSTDNGKTFTKYEGNPVIPHLIGGNRDPKIVYCEETQCHLLALYLDGCTYGLFRTDDLIRFEKIQEIVLPGESECPDLYPLTADDGTRHWILSGAHGKYLVCTIRDGQFLPEQDLLSLHEGSMGYAAQTFSSLPDGRRVHIAWDTLGAFPGHAPFASQMGLPTVHTLRKRPEGYVIRPEPIKEAESLRRSPLRIVPTTDGYRTEVRGVAVELCVTLPAEGGEVVLSLLGQTLVFDRARKELRLDRDRRLRLDSEDGLISARLFFDTCSLEVITCTREACFSVICDDNLWHVSLRGDPEATLSGWNLGRA